MLTAEEVERMTIADIALWAANVLEIQGDSPVMPDQAEDYRVAETLADLINPRNHLQRHMINGSGIDVDQYPADINGRPILPGDTLKVYHFTGTRNKKHYMYKYVAGVAQLPSWEIPALVINHLHADGGQYMEYLTGKQLVNTEIVQGFGFDRVPYHERNARSFAAAS